MQAPKYSRPKIDVPRSALTWAVEILAFVALVGGIVYLAIVWPQVPNRVPQHFNWAGQPDAWGTKAILWMLPGFGAALFIMLTTLARFPHRFNFMWPITEQNALPQYRIAVSLLAWLKLIIVGMFDYMTWSIVEVAMGRTNELGPGFLPVVLGLVFGSILVHLLVAYRAR